MKIETKFNIGDRIWHSGWHGPVDNEVVGIVINIDTAIDIKYKLKEDKTGSDGVWTQEFIFSTKAEVEKYEDIRFHRVSDI